MFNFITWLTLYNYDDVQFSRSQGPDLTEDKYSQLSEEAIILNTIGVILIALAVVVPVIVSCQGWRRGGEGGEG